MYDFRISEESLEDETMFKIVTNFDHWHTIFQSKECSEEFRRAPAGTNSESPYPSSILVSAPEGIGDRAFVLVLIANEPQLLLSLEAIFRVRMQSELENFFSESKTIRREATARIVSLANSLDKSTRMRGVSTERSVRVPRGFTVATLVAIVALGIIGWTVYREVDRLVEEGLVAIGGANVDLRRAEELVGDVERLHSDNVTMTTEVRNKAIEVGKERTIVGGMEEEVRKVLVEVRAIRKAVEGSQTVVLAARSEVKSALGDARKTKDDVGVVERGVNLARDKAEMAASSAIEARDEVREAEVRVAAGRQEMEVALNSANEAKSESGTYRDESLEAKSAAKGYRDDARVARDEVSRLHSEAIAAKLGVSGTLDEARAILDEVRMVVAKVQAEGVNRDEARAPAGDTRDTETEELEISMSESKVVDAPDGEGKERLETTGRKDEMGGLVREINEEARDGTQQGGRSVFPHVSEEGLLSFGKRVAELSESQPGFPCDAETGFFVGQGRKHLTYVVQQYFVDEGIELEGGTDGVWGKHSVGAFLEWKKKGSKCGDLDGRSPVEWVYECVCEG